MNAAEMPSGSEEEEEEEVSDHEVQPRRKSQMQSDDEEMNDAEDDDDMVPEEVVDDEEVEEDEPPPPPPPPPKVSQKSLQTYLKPKDVAAEKKKKTPAPKPAQSKPTKGKAPSEPVRTAEKGGKTYSPHSDSDEEHEDDVDDDALEVNMMLPTKKKVPLQPDAMQEYEDQRAASVQGPTQAAQGAAEEEPTVHESAKEVTIFLRNEKTNKWCALSSDALVYAPEVSGAIKTQLDQLTIPGKKERGARQSAMFDENATKMMGTVKIAKLQMDGAGGGTVPAMTNLLMLQSVDLTDAQAEVEFLTEKASNLKAGAGPGGAVKRVEVCTMLDSDIVKRMYAVHKCPLPQTYNPNTNASNKYKVPAKLEDLAKTDSNLTLLGQVERGKKAGTKRAAENSGAGAAAKKSAAPPVAAAQNGHADADDEAEEEDGNGIVVDKSGPCFTRIKWTAIPSMGVSMAGIKCAPGTDVRLVPAGEGSYILVKTPAGP